MIEKLFNFKIAITLFTDDAGWVLNGSYAHTIDLTSEALGSFPLTVALGVILVI